MSSLAHSRPRRNTKPAPKLTYATKGNSTTITIKKQRSSTPPASPSARSPALKRARAIAAEVAAEAAAAAAPAAAPAAARAPAPVQPAHQPPRKLTLNLLLDTPFNRRIVNKNAGREVITDYKLNTDDVPDLERVQDDIEYLLLEADQIRDYKHFDAGFKHQIYVPVSTPNGKSFVLRAICGQSQFENIVQSATGDSLLLALRYDEKFKKPVSPTPKSPAQSPVISPLAEAKMPPRSQSPSTPTTEKVYLFVRYGTQMVTDEKKAFTRMQSRDTGLGMMLMATLPAAGFTTTAAFSTWVFDAILASKANDPAPFAQLALDLDGRKVWTFNTEKSIVLTEPQLNTHFLPTMLSKDIIRKVGSNDTDIKKGYFICVSNKNGMKKGARILPGFVEDVILCNTTEKTSTHKIKKSFDSLTLERHIQTFWDAEQRQRQRAGEPVLVLNDGCRGVWLRELLQGHRKLEDGTPDWSMFCEITPPQPAKDNLNPLRRLTQREKHIGRAAMGMPPTRSALGASAYGNDALERQKLELLNLKNENIKLRAEIAAASAASAAASVAPAASAAAIPAVSFDWYGSDSGSDTESLSSSDDEDDDDDDDDDLLLPRRVAKLTRVKEEPAQEYGELGEELQPASKKPRFIDLAGESTEDEEELIEDEELFDSDEDSDEDLW